MTFSWQFSWFFIMRMTKNPQDQMINFYTYDPSQQKQKQTKHKGTGLKVLVNLQTFVSTVECFFNLLCALSDASVQRAPGGVEKGQNWFKRPVQVWGGWTTEHWPERNSQKNSFFLISRWCRKRTLTTTRDHPLTPSPKLARCKLSVSLLNNLSRTSMLYVLSSLITDHLF